MVHAASHFDYKKRVAWVPVSMQTCSPVSIIMELRYKCASFSLWPSLTFFKLKITYILKSSGWGLEKSELHGNKMFYSRKCVFCRTTSLPSFNVLRFELAKIALLIYRCNIVLSV